MKFSRLKENCYEKRVKIVSDTLRMSDYRSPTLRINKVARNVLNAQDPN